MSENSEQRSWLPYAIVGGVIVVVLLVVLLWPSSAPEPQPVTEPVTPAVAQPEPIEPEPTDTFEATPPPEPVEIDPDQEIEPMPEPVAEPEPLDISDTAIKTALEAIATSPTLSRLLVNDGLLQRFVVSTTNLANNEMAPNHRLLTPPDQDFRVYTQANREWIDSASYKRYTPYVDALESMSNEDLIELYSTYEEEIQAKYAEIGDPDQPFSEVLIEAIDTLLDTPEVKMPVEVYTDSVMYKYADDRLENLSAPQKQLLRTGPDNMRRIKAKLRELRDSLMAQ
ncbi:DUF3014 domain-containing protein [Alteromonas lipolytica]|uniref:DUF3014 domain-containing protein n=1 Tax=Alteromonas lipolytica TaxID=1856405 RepID=A0A1E8FAJ8_9ALTE|nr:DUF3014 domain-containing protein [Alteromonas lipolytica]OFI32952.1 hypothetical protein BFC17_01355 [Alteromonas lipolytica]GGF63942.1 hypothetical protein GCM10011338_15370 [Alteromonas lipolytica]